MSCLVFLILAYQLYVSYYFYYLDFYSTLDLVIFSHYIFLSLRICEDSPSSVISCYLYAPDQMSAKQRIS